jgi:hypothetical protein
MGALSLTHSVAGDSFKVRLNLDVTQWFTPARFGL